MWHLTYFWSRCNLHLVLSTFYLINFINYRVLIKEGIVRIEGRLLKHKLKIFTLMLTCTGLHLVETEERKLTTSQNIIRNNKKEYKIRDILQIYRHKSKPNVFIADHVTRRLVIHTDNETERDQWINLIVEQMVRKGIVINFKNIWVQKF